MAFSTATDLSSNEGSSSSIKSTTASMYSSSPYPASNVQRTTSDTISHINTPSDVSTQPPTEAEHNHERDNTSLSSVTASTEYEDEKASLDPAKRSGDTQARRFEGQKDQTDDFQERVLNEKKSFNLESGDSNRGRVCSRPNSMFLHTCFLPKLNSLRNRGLLCDVKIVCQGAVFKAHVAVLEAFSSYFAARIERARHKERQRRLKNFEVEKMNQSVESFKSCLLPEVKPNDTEVVPQENQTLHVVTVGGDLKWGDNKSSQSNNVVVLKIMRDDINGFCVRVAEDCSNNQAERVDCGCNTHDFSIDSYINECITTLCCPEHKHFSHSVESNISSTTYSTAINCSSCPVLLPSIPRDTSVLPALPLPLPKISKLDLPVIPSISEVPVESPSFSLPRLALSSLQLQVPADLPALDLSSLSSSRFNDTLLITLQLGPVGSLSTSYSTSTIKNYANDGIEPVTLPTNLHKSASEEVPTARSPKLSSSVHNVVVSPYSPTSSPADIIENESASRNMQGKLEHHRSSESGTFVFQVPPKRAGSSVHLPPTKKSAKHYHGSRSTNREIQDTFGHQVPSEGLPHCMSASAQHFEDDLLSISVNITDPDILDILLEYAYTGSLRKLRRIPVKKYCEVNSTARRMGVEVNVFDPKVIRQALSSKNFGELWQLADCCRNREMADVVATYVAKRLDRLWSSKELQKLTFSRLLTTLLHAVQYTLKTDLMLRTILFWLRKDIQHRCCTLKEFMPLIELSDISKNFATQLLGSSEIIQYLPLLRAELLNRFKMKPSNPEFTMKTTKDRAMAANDVCVDAFHKKSSCKNSWNIKTSPNSIVCSKSTCSKGPLNDDWPSNHVSDVDSLVGALSKGTVSNSANCDSSKIARHLGRFVKENSSMDPYVTGESSRVATAKSATSGASGYRYTNKTKLCYQKLASDISKTKLHQYEDIPSILSNLSLKKNYLATDETPWSFTSTTLTPRLGDISRPLTNAECEKSPSLVIVGEDKLSRKIIMLTLNMGHHEYIGDPDYFDVQYEDQQTIYYLDGYIIVVGGERKFRREKMKSVTVCDIRSSWQASLPDMNVPRSNASVFLYNSILYVTGGEGRYYDAMSQVESLNMKSKSLRWRMMPCMKSKRSGHSIVRDMNGCAYVIGGGTNKCESYNPVFEKWFDVPSLPQEFVELKPILTIVGRRLIAINYYRPKRIYVLDLEENGCVWRPERLTGKQPDWIVSVTSWGETVYVLDQKLEAIFSFRYSEKRWEKEMKINQSKFIAHYISMKCSSEGNPGPLLCL